MGSTTAYLPPEVYRSGPARQEIIPSKGYARPNLRNFDLNFSGYELIMHVGEFTGVDFVLGVFLIVGFRDVSILPQKAKMKTQY